MSKIKDILVDKLDFPYELFHDEAKLIVYGSSRVVIERHRGIVVYSDREIKIAQKHGVVCISGSGLTLRNYGKDDITIDGEIDGISYGEV